MNSGRYLVQQKNGVTGLGLKRAKILDFSSKTDPYKPGIFSEIKMADGQTCLARITAIRKVVNSNLTGQLVIADQVVELGDLKNGFIKTTIHEKDERYPYVSSFAQE